MTDAEFAAALPKSVNLADVRHAAWAARRQSEDSKLLYGSGDPVSDEDIIAAAWRAVPRGVFMSDGAKESVELLTEIENIILIEVLNFKKPERAGTHCRNLANNAAVKIRDRAALRASPPAAPAGGEPVAWRWRNKFTAKIIGDDAWNYTAANLTPSELLEVEPLYAAPPQSNGDEGELEQLRIERDALKGEVSDVCEIANGLREQLAKARAALEASKAAMLRTRTASIAGCEEGYGKPEKWGDELFASHGDLTKAINLCDAALKDAQV